MSVNIKELKTILKAALVPHRNKEVNFSARDAQEAAINALLSFHGLSANSSYRDTRKLANMAVIEEVIDEVLPLELENIMGDWAEIRQFGRDEEVKFTIRGIGKRRALLSIVPGARGGVYKARRLDDKNLFIDTQVYTVGLMVTLEEIILGKLSLSELMTNILQGIQFEIYKNIVKALRTAKTQAPAANRASGAGFVAAEADKAIRVAQQYGAPVIVTFQGLAAKISNAQGSSNPSVSVNDPNEIRSQGYVSIYKGTPVLRIPNFLTDESNANWVFSEADAFILPTSGKLVIVAMKGEGYVAEFTHPSGSVEQNYHKIMGTAILTHVNICIYTDTDIVAAESGKVLV